jgi:hypothetical protein
MFNPVFEFFAGLNPILAVIILAFVVWLIVWFLDKLNFLDEGLYQRIGVIVATYVLSGVLPDDAEKMLSALVTGMLAVIFNEFKKWLTPDKKK